MNSKTIGLMIAAFALSVGTLRADELTLQRDNMKDWDAQGNWVGYGTGSSYAKEWSQLSGHGYWDGIDVMAAGNTYVVPENKHLRMGGSGADPFPGDLLVLKKGAHFISYSSKDFGPKMIRIDGNDAGFVSYTGVGESKKYLTDDTAARFSGPIFLNIKSYEKVAISAGQRCTGMVFAGKISGTGYFKMYTYNLDAVTGGSTRGWGAPEDYLNITNVLIRDRLEITGDTSDAKIDIEINPGNRLLLGSDIAQQVWVKEMGSVDGDPARTPYNGSVFGISAADRKPKIGTLKLGNYVSLEVPVSTTAFDAGYPTVTNSLQFTRKNAEEDLVIKVLLRTKPYELRTGEERKLPILKLAAGAAGSIDPANFEYVGTLDKSFADFKRFETTTDASGTTLYAVFELLYPIVRQQYAMTGGDTKIYPKTWAEETSVTKDGVTYYFWDDEREIRPGNDYYADKGIRMPRGEFPGETLIIPAGCTGVFNWGERLSVDDIDKTCVIGNLLFEGNATLGIWADSNSDYRQYAMLGGVMRVNGLLQVPANENRRQGLRIKSKVIGGSGTEIRVNKPTQIDPTKENRKIDPEYFRPDVRLEGDCSDFHGTFTVESNALCGVVSFPGTLKALNGSLVRPISATTAAVMATGVIEGNVVLEFPCDPANGTAGSLTFTDGCTIGRNCVIRPTGVFRPLPYEKFEVTLLSVPDDGKSAAITPEMFQYDFSQGERLATSAREFSVVKEDGCARLVMTVRKRGFFVICR